MRLTTQRRTPGSAAGAGSELVRLLARLADAPPAETRPAFAERLGQWLSWSDAIALSAALDAATSATTPAGPAPARPRALGADEADFQRVRATLDAAIVAGPTEPAADPTDFGPHRRHCSARQHAMEDAVGALRQRLREALARRSPAGARLAGIDAVMERTLAAHERSLLGLVPLRLQAHFERLRRAAASDATAIKGSPGPAEVFPTDMVRVLRAELAHRLLPAQGLLDALRTD